MRQLKHGDKIRFIVETEHFDEGFETVVEDVEKIEDSEDDGDGGGFRVMGTCKMICGPYALVQYLHGEHWEFVD